MYIYIFFFFFLKQKKTKNFKSKLRSALSYHKILNLHSQSDSVKIYS